MSQGTILLIDDEESLLELMTLHLELSGFDCIGTKNTLEAEKVLALKTVDLIICDLNLPNESGLDFFYRLKTSFHSLPDFIFCSGVTDSPIEPPYPSGIRNFFFKPFAMADLVKEAEKNSTRDSNLNLTN